MSPVRYSVEEDIMTRGARLLAGAVVGLLAVGVALTLMAILAALAEVAPMGAGLIVVASTSTAAAVTWRAVSARRRLRAQLAALPGQDGREADLRDDLRDAHDAVLLLATRLLALQRDEPQHLARWINDQALQVRWARAVLVVWRQVEVMRRPGPGWSPEELLDHGPVIRAADRLVDAGEADRVGKARARRERRLFEELGL